MDSVRKHYYYTKLRLIELNLFKRMFGNLFTGIPKMFCKGSYTKQVFALGLQEDEIVRLKFLDIEPHPSYYPDLKTKRFLFTSLL